MCEDGSNYYATMLVIGDLVINRANITAAAFLAGTDDTPAMINILTTGFHDGDEGLTAESLSLGGREAEALRHALFSGAYDVLKALDCHEEKHVYKDGEFHCANCRQWSEERYNLVKGITSPPDTDSIPF